MRARTSRSVTRSWPASTSARATGSASNRRCGPCSRSTRPYGPTAAVAHGLPRRPLHRPSPAPTTPDSRPAAGRPDAPMETRGDRRPLRRHHPAHHVSAALPMGRHRAHPQTRARPLRSHSLDLNPLATSTNRLTSRPWDKARGSRGERRRRSSVAGFPGGDGPGDRRPHGRVAATELTLTTIDKATGSRHGKPPARSARPPQALHGLTISIPVSSKSFTFRVAHVALFTRQIAAI